MLWTRDVACVAMCATNGCGDPNSESPPSQPGLGATVVLVADGGSSVEAVDATTGK